MDEEPDTADQSPDESQASKRSRFKNALSRTKTKINKKRQEFRDRTESDGEKTKPDVRLPDDVDDFLNSGRSSATSPHSTDQSSLLYDPTPRPSTSDSASQLPKPPQLSPRRVDVPRIDVSSSQRFPNAKPVPEAKPSGSPFSASNSSGLLQPEYKPRSQSFTSISSERRARIRGLSVGFIDSPPVIIGEGGDEAESPPVEISKAKARARSASPTGRRAYPPTTKASHLPAVIQAGRPPGYGNYTPPGAALPKPRSGSLNYQSPIRKELDQSALNEQNDPAFVPPSVKRTGTGMSAMNKEFEMTLGMGPVGSAPGGAPKPANEASIVAPKPQRPPPSYTLIEHGGAAEKRPNKMLPIITSSSHPLQKPQPPPEHLKYTPPPPQPTQPIQPYKPFSADQQQVPPSTSAPPPVVYPPPSQPPATSVTATQQNPLAVQGISLGQQRPPPPPPPVKPMVEVAPHVQTTFPPPPPRHPVVPSQDSGSANVTKQRTPVPTPSPKPPTKPVAFDQPRESPPVRQATNPMEIPAARNSPGSRNPVLPPPAKPAVNNPILARPTYDLQETGIVSRPSIQTSHLQEHNPSPFQTPSSGDQHEANPFHDSPPTSASSKPARAGAPRLPPLRHKKGDVQEVSPPKNFDSSPVFAERVPLMSNLEIGLNTRDSPLTPASGQGSRFYSKLNEESYPEGFI